MSDSGRIVQVASWCQGAKPGVVTDSVSTARCWAVTLSDTIDPTGAPAMRTCWA